ncbi:MFS transporter [Streptosporangium sp. NPDC003464]
MSTSASPAGDRPSRAYWPAVVAVSLGTFSVVTTEMSPVGLLTSVGSDLKISAGVAGLAVTLPGIVAALAAPVLTVAAGRADRRLVLCALMALLTVANLLSALAPGAPTLIASRALVGLGIGGFWSIAAGLAVRLVPERSTGAATSMIFGGVSIASVLGVPAGTLVGELAGWRAAFAALAILCAAVTAALALLLPPLTATRAIRFGQVPRLLRDRGVRTGLTVTLLLVTGHFAAFTYLGPVVGQVSGAGAGLLSALLLVYGVAGVAGNFAAGPAAARNVRGTVLLIAGTLAAVVLLLPGPGAVRAGMIVLLAVWGLAYGGVSVSLQTWMLRAVPQAPEAGAALFVSSFNAAISLGALLGGVTVDSLGASGVTWAGGTLAALAAAAVWLSGRDRGGDAFPGPSPRTLSGPDGKPPAIDSRR